MLRIRNSSRIRASRLAVRESVHSCLSNHAVHLLALTLDGVCLSRQQLLSQEV